MNAPITPELIDGRYELYRVITDYEGLQDGFADRIEDLNTTLEQIDMAGGFAKGNAQKLQSKSKTRLARIFGWESLGKMLKGTGLALVLVVDDERFAPLKEQLGARRKPPVRSIARIGKPRWLFTPKKASKQAKKRWAGVPESKRKKMMRKVAKAGWKARRANARKSLAPERPTALAANQVGSSQTLQCRLNPALMLASRAPQ